MPGTGEGFIKSSAINFDDVSIETLGRTQQEDDMKLRAC
jgi:hypothetical protein